MTIGREPRRYDRPASEAPEHDLAADLAFPKPRYVPQGERADLTNAPVPRDEADRNSRYLDFVRSEICAVWGEDGCHCGGVTEAAHLIGGMGRKRSDYLTVPLCSNHHRLGAGAQHNLGLTQFQIQYSVNLWEVSTRLLIRWIRMMR